MNTHAKMQYSLAVAVLATACGGALAPEVRVREPVPLARFMREHVNVPYAFAQLESDGGRRPIRFERAAFVLKKAARDLVHWDDPPGGSDAARDVFYVYARDLERQVARFETAARSRDLDETEHRLERIRVTCNSCHRFFRPASSLSDDVAIDRDAIIQLGSL